MLIERVTSALDALAGASGAGRHAWSVPGRIEVLGKHTDYAGGRSLVCATARGFVIASAARADSRVRMIDAVGDTSIEFDLTSALPSHQLQPWAVYPTTMARRLSANFGASTGADLAFASDLPAAAGLSSSSALMIATFLALAEANDVARRQPYAANIHDALDLASYLATVENGSSFGTLAGERGVGTQGGSEDHTAIVCSRERSLGQYSFVPAREERVVPMPAGYRFVVAASGIVAEKTGAAREAYNRAAAMTDRILEIWHAATARRDPTLAAALASSADARERLARAIHDSSDRAFGARPLLARLTQFADESNRIVPSAGDALARGDLVAFGTLVEHSQRHAEERLGNQVPETIALARSARELGAAAASAFGAGFGGSVWSLVEERTAVDFCERWRERYTASFPARAADATFFVTSAARAAHQLF